MANPRTNILLISPDGITIINNMTYSICQNCISETMNVSSFIVECPKDKMKRRVLAFKDNQGSLFVCDDKEKTTKNFLSMTELLKHGRSIVIDKYKNILDNARREAAKELDTFKHNIVHINADAINEFYSFIPQESLFSNYRQLQETIADTVKKHPKDAVDLIARLAQYNFNLKTELSVVSKLNSPNSKPSYANGNPRDAIMSSVYMLYPLFKKHSVHINVGNFWEKFDIDYDALQVASFYIIENSVKYSMKDSSVNIEFIRHPHSLLIIFNMTSFYISEVEEKMIFNEGYQGEQAIASKRGGKGIGLYRDKRLVSFFEGELYLEAGDNDSTGSDGYTYAQNKFIIELPIKMSI